MRKKKKKSEKPAPSSSHCCPSSSGYTSLFHCDCVLLATLLAAVPVTHSTKYFVFKKLLQFKGLMEINEIVSQM